MQVQAQVEVRSRFIAIGVMARGRRKSKSMKQQTQRVGKRVLPISEQIRLKNETISKRQARRIIEKIPHLQQNREDRLFFFEMIRWATRKDPDTGLPYARNYEIAMVFGKSPKHCNTEQELEGVKQRFLPALEWTGYTFNENGDEKGKARMFKNTGLGELKNAVLYDYDPERVYVDSLKPFSTRKQEEACRALKRNAELIDWSYIDQDVLAGYLHGHSLQQFKKIVEANYHNALMEAFRHKDSEGQLKLLSDIRDMPMPFYFPSGNEKSRCPRIWGRGIPALAREVRQELCRGWTDLDIQSCQAAIVAGRWSAPLIQELVQSGKSIWTALFDFMGIAQADRRNAKPTLKEATYGIIYGMRINNAEDYVADGLRNAHISYSARFTDCPLIRDLHATIIRSRRQIRKEGGAMGAYGWMPLGDTDIDSFLSYVVQSYELFLIAACYGEAREATRRSAKHRFSIMLHQHDGVSIALGEGADKDVVIAGLRAAVKFAGEEMGIAALLVEDKVAEPERELVAEC